MITIDRKQVLEYGVIYGAIFIVYSLVTYLLGVEYMVNWVSFLISMLLPFVLAFILGRKIRATVGGYMTWKESFMNLMAMILAGTFLAVAFNIFLNTIIDPELPYKVFDQTVESSMALMENLGAGEEDMNKTYAEFEKQRENIMDNYSFLGFLQTYLWLSVYGAIVAAITSVVLKRENPNPFVDSE